MARLPRATIALMLALLPAAATVIGFVVRGQIRTLKDLAGIALVIAGVALHHEGRNDASSTAVPSRPLPTRRDD